MKNKEITEIDILKSIEKITGLELKCRIRDNEYTTCRVVYYDLCYNNIKYPNNYNAHTTIATLVNRKRSSVRHCLVKIDSFKTGFYDEIHRKAEIDLGLYDNTVDKLEKLEESKVISAILNDLKDMSDADLSDFHQTRLKPFKRVLESRVKQKEIKEVKGALLNI